ncbi:MAG: fimbrial assembly protein PilC [Gemmatimonadota bacterium]
MSGYRFRAHSPDGRAFKGVIQANSVEEVERTLAKQRLIADHIRAEPLDQSLKLRRTPAPRALVQFARQFATLIEAAVPLLLSLEILQGLTDDRALKQALSSVTADISGGSTLADALRRQPKCFSGIFVAIVDAGEQGGSLDVSLNRLADYMERAQEIRDRVRGAMIYPAVIAMVAVGSVVALLTLVVPTFESMFAASGMGLPVPTLVLVTASRFLAAQWSLVLVVVLFASLVAKAFYGTEGGRRLTHRLLLRLPVAGPMALKFSVARFSRTAASLLASGVSILDVMAAASRTSGNALVEEALLRSRERIAGGSGVSDPLAIEPVIPAMLPQMLSVGEQTGRLDDMFDKVADFYEREVDADVEGLLKALEPVLVVLVGVVLGGMVIAMYLPIFDAIGAVDPVSVG